VPVVAKEYHELANSSFIVTEREYLILETPCNQLVLRPGNQWLYVMLTFKPTCGVTTFTRDGM
jgi:hypothetical protein